MPNSVTVLPINGIGNRLRAIASSRYLASRLKREFYILWEPEPYLQAAAHELFQNGGPLIFVSREDAIRDELIANEDVPLYLNETRSQVTLRGYDRGEQ